MSYVRVLPRDLFNEAGLLKAVGRVVILLGNFSRHHARLIEQDVPCFQIEQDDSSGAIRIANLTFLIHETEWYLERPLNSRKSWSLQARLPDYSEGEIEVFTEDGRFTRGFCDLIEMEVPQ